MFKESLLILISTPIYALLIGFEFFMSYFHEHNYYNLKDTLSNVYLMLLNMGLDILVRGLAFGVLIFFAQFSFFQWEYGVLYWTCLFLAEDFVFYWLHRFDHSIRFFWAIHVTHHSSENFNLTTGFRSSVFQPLYRFLYFIPLVLFGFQPLDIFLMYSITQIYGIIIHTQMVDKLGFLEYILVTPSHHRVHHASNVLYLDKNLGMCLIFWDKLFGTFQAEDDKEPVKYGLHGKTIERDAVNVVLHEWKSIYQDIGKTTSFMDKVRYVLNPPGWSHDGSTQTAEELRKDLLKNK